jgi:hypothetical protein
MYAVPVNGSQGEFQVGKSQPLFEVRNVFPLGSPFDPSHDGKRFLVLKEQEGSASPMMLVLNWTAELGK